MKKSNSFKKILFIVLIIFLLLASIIMLIKTNRVNKINNINQVAMGLYTTKIGDVSLDITNQVTEKPNSPKISAGMIPIKYKDGSWQITTEDDEEWCNSYNNGKMACMMLNDGVYQSEMQVNMTNKKIATVGTQLQESEMGTIFTWVPRFAYNEENEVLYLKETSSIAGDYKTSEIFTYLGSAVNKEDIALSGIWVEQKSGLLNEVNAQTLNSENNTYGFIGNTKAENLILDSNFINSINSSDITGITNISDNKMILKVIDEKVTEPIMAKFSTKGKKVKVEIIKADNGIKQVITENGDIFESNEDKTEFTITVEKGGLNRFIIIDNAGNQRLYEITIVSPEIYVLTNQDEYVEFNGEKWYPYGTQVRIQYMDNMSGIKGWYKEINGTIPTEPMWTNNGTSKYKDFTAYETMVYKAKIEDNMGEILGEDELTVHIMPRDNAALPSYYYNYNLGGIYPVQVTGTASTSTAYGTETYPYNTYIRDAARHMGLIQPKENKVLYIKIVPSPQGGYIGSSRNGVNTSSYSYNDNGYVFVTEDGQEILLPKINDVSSKIEDNKITVTVDAKSFNGDKQIEKYYYSIDNGEYEESNSNEFIFEEIQAYQNHTINVYVKDSYGIISEIYTTTNKTSNAIPVPTIEIVDEENLETIEYDGKIWYPYNTQIKITYAEDMTNLTAYYTAIYETTKQLQADDSSLGSVTNYTFTLSETMTYKAKIKDSTGQETEEVSKTIYIMPYTQGSLQTNYYNNIGAIYPVRVTGYNSGTVYGTDTYMYQTRIRASAMHMGLVETNETKDLYIKIVESPAGGYKSSTRNGITSSTYNNNYNGYIFVTKDGEEIKSPIIESAVLTSGENSLTVTVTAIATTNNATIEKYYYSIDDENYEESSENTYTFSDINGYKNHTINVYVKDSNRSQSDNVNVIGRPTNTIPIPTIEIIDEENLETIEYDGKIWYPYNTQIKITYAEDMTNLTAYYTAIYETTKQLQADDSSLGSVTNYTFTLSETMTYKAKIKDSTGQETEEVSKTIYIMPYTQGSLQTNYYNNIGAIYPVRVTGYNSGTVYGTDTYMYQTRIRASAMHMGLVETNETKDLYIKIVESPVGGYKSSTRNGITSREYLTNDNGYIFVKEDGTEIKSPILNSLTTVGGENTITATIEMDYYNGATPNKYYYKIDNEAYIESSDSTYTFENVVPYQNHTINVYAKDSNGAISEIYTTTNKTSNEIPKPIIEIVNKESLETVEYDGKTWYPYGTQIKITYADDMTNLTAYYTATYETTKQLQANNSSLGSVTNYTFTLSETMTYYAKNVDATGEEGEIEELEINIMPNTTLQSNYATYCVGEIFPVIVTGSTSGSIYGSEIYSYNSYIARAAMHMGLVENGQKQKLFIKVINKPEDYYRSVKRNGITSNENWSNYNGYVFVTEDGTEIKNNDTQTGDVTLTVAKGSRYTLIDGQKYYLPGTQITIHYTGSGTNYYASQIGTSNVSWTNINESSYTTDVTQTTTYYAKIEDAQGNIVTKKTFKINIVNSNNSVYGSYNIGDIVAVQVTGTTSGSVWGTDIYTSDSNVSKAATHAGLVQVGETKIVYVKIIEGQSSYSGTTRNGVTTSSYSKWPQSFIFLTDQGGTTESTESSDVNISPLPEEEIGEITISVPEDTKYLEYKGEKWYPYGTKVTITYEGTGTRNHYYGYINNITNSGSGWSSNGTSSTWTTTVYESTTYYAKIVNALGDIAVETKETINIMPYASGYSSNQSNYWNSSYLGKIYAVEVTGTTNGTIYGTNYYEYSSNINTAATHMGLVTSGQTATVYIKTIAKPSDGYISTTNNGITSSASTSNNGFVFVTASGEEIIYNKVGDVGATLSGYNVINNGNYYFKNDGDSIIPNNGENKNLIYTTAHSYIELDFRNYSPDDIIAIRLNAEASCEGADYGYATITKTIQAPEYDNLAGRFVYISGTVKTQDYFTYINGGEKYYLHLGYRKDQSIDRDLDIVKFNSLTVKKLENMKNPTIEINSTYAPITDRNGETWYSYGTQITITFDEDANKYYKIQYPNGNIYTSGQVTNGNTTTITITESSIIKAGYTGDCEQAELKINIMPYTTGTMQQNYYNNIGAIYPVQVTGTTSGTIYGTGTYYYGSNINTAATHMGLVKDGEEKLVYIKIIEFPEGGYKSSLMNNIKSNEYTTAQNGYIFVDENGDEILEQTDWYPVTLSGYKVYANDLSYYFTNEGDAIRGVGYYYSGYYPARSYIILDYSNYSENDLFKVTLNAENTENGYMYATITTKPDPLSNSSNSGRFINVKNKTEVDDYSTIIKGGQKYYLHLERYHSSSSYNTSYYAQFNSLKVEPISIEELVPTITVDESAEPVWFNDEPWYPYGTKVTISWGDSNYTNINGSNYHLYKYKNETTGTVNNWTSNGTSSTYTTTLSQSTTYYAKYKENSEEVSLKINIMPDDAGASNYSSYIDGKIYPITITGDNSSPYGNNIYLSYYTSGWNSYYTYVSRAATHLGIVNSGEQKTVYIKIVSSPEGGYKSVKKYNSTSSSYTDTSYNGFMFVTEDGTEIVAPTVKSASLSIGSETTIIATMDVQGNNGASIKKYYYSIDDGPYQESESNIYTFTDIEAYKIHSVKMYARDENNATSELQEFTTNVVTNNVTPTITIDENVTPIEDKEGNEWYPYGTQLTITYADDMTNLRGYYQYIDERNRKYE